MLKTLSEAQLSALLAKLKDDAGLKEKLLEAGNLDAALALANEAGFEVSKADWLKYQEKQTTELSDRDLESVAGGKSPSEYTHPQLGTCDGVPTMCNGSPSGECK